MAGMKESITAIGFTIQPIPNTYNEPNTTTDLMAISAPDNGSDPIKAQDPTLTGAIFSAPDQLVSRRGRAGATAALRGPGGSAPFAAGSWVIGRILQAAGFAEVINPTEIVGTALTGGTTTSINMAAASSAVDDFYMGMPIQHAGIGVADSIRGTAIIRDYIGATKTAILCETLAAAITSGQYRIPPSVTYLLGTGASIPLISAKVWRHRKAYRYRDCALSSFAINIPVANDQSTDLPSIEFTMVGVPIQSVDELAPALPSSLLTPVPGAKAGKFTFAGAKLGHQSLRLEFGLEAGAPPNQNFDFGQEGYETLSGTRTITVDLNEQLVAQLDLDAIADAQQLIAMQSGWGGQKGNRFLVGLPNNVIDPLSPNPRNGFVGVSGSASPSDIDKSVSLSLIW